MDNNKRYPAKLLLFGEHIVLHGATALAVPTTGFGGQWRFAPTTPDEKTAHAQLGEVIARFGTTMPLDLKKLRNDHAKGLFFASNIPQGYGLGSSGALCAAIYDVYGQPPKPTSHTETKNILAAMEATIHGTSSGVDPFTSFSNWPVLIKEGVVEMTPTATAATAPFGIECFLADTGRKRASGAFIQWFKEQYTTNAAFSAQVESVVKPLNAELVRLWLERGKADTFMELAYDLSAWQRKNLLPLLPPDPTLLQWWDKTLAQADLATCFKLCGAGGGGYVLGFTTDRARAIAQARSRGINIAFPLQ
jgi:mevalonate kinase